MNSLVRLPSPSRTSRIFQLVDFLEKEKWVGQEIVFEPSTIARERTAQWRRAQIDLGELARLRQAGWTSKQLQRHFGFGRTKINLELRRLRMTVNAPITARKSGQC